MFSEDVVISPKEIFTAPPVIVIFALVPTVISFTSTLASNVGVFIVTDPPATTAKLSTVVETKGSPVIAIKLLVLSVISPLETVLKNYLLLKIHYLNLKLIVDHLL